ncbi:MAG TPA: phosphatidate cytidylyltransferase [Bacillota bacterium]
MSKRIFWGGLAALSSVVIIWMGGIYYAVIVGVLTLLALHEYAELLKKQNLRPQTALLAIISIGLLTVIFILAQNPRMLPGQFPKNCERFLTLALVIVFFITLGFELFRGDPDQGLINAAANLFGAVYIGFMFAYILLLRFISSENGLFYLIFTTFVTWANDTAAYFIGVKFGKHKLSPRISPKKTVEGSFGGLAGGVVTAFFLATLFQEPLFFFGILGAIVVIAGQFGDLIESIIKRNAGVKDSGSFLPGHGGVLDRFDSLLLSAPVVYYAIVYVAPFFNLT